MERVDHLSLGLKKEGGEGKEIFSHVKLAPPDPILGTAVAFRNDPDASKINLGIGAYRDDTGAPYLFPIVKKVEQEILSDKKLDKEYMPIEGHAGFISGAQNLLFGEDSIPLKEGRIASVQSLSGTGALRIGFEFLKQYLPSTMYISNPTWANHPGMLDRCRIKYVEYPYYNPETKSVDIKGMISALEKAEPRSIILLHACAHNPTGVDPTENQWKQISEVMKKNSLFPFFDSAYQGFASGDIDKDAWAIRYFMSQGFQMFVAQSFAKNMGLYGERIGAFHAVCATKDTKERVLSQIKPIVRTNYSNPPLHGARIADKILNDKTNLQIWKKELKEVAHRIIEMRTVLRKRLEEMKTPGTWHHITDQIGMFSYTGLTESQCDILIKKYHVYLLRSGRVSMAGVNSKNVGYLADAIKNSIEEAK